MASSIQESNLTRDEWITPVEQLERLSPEYYANEVYRNYPEIGLDLADLIGDLAAKRSNVLNLWYTALKILQILPQRIPPLPLTIHGILESPCPIFGGDKKVEDTHSLYLIPPGSLDELERKVFSCGEKLYPTANPLRFEFFWDKAREIYASTQLNAPYWALMTNDILPGSGSMDYETQIKMIKNLRRNTGIDYEIPTLRSAVMIIFLHKISTGEDIYPYDEEQINFRPVYTRVQETTFGCHLVVGGFAPPGLCISRFDGPNEFIGIAALRKFS